MPEVRLTFLDGEVMRADTDLINFEQPVIKARTIDGDSNNEELTIPLSSLKYIVMSGAEASPDDDEMAKMVIHFTDHEVLRAFAGRDTLGGPYGVIYTLVEPEGHVRRRIGVPYTAVKAIFKVKAWQGPEAGTRRRPAPTKAAAKKPASTRARPKKPIPKRSAAG